MSVTPLRPIQSSIETRVTQARQQIEACLAQAIPAAETWPRALHEAQRHALLSPGKRFRPLLTVFLTEGCGGSDKANEAAVDVGCVVEMVHAASLILDDLPCMDDADLRRNQPTTHVAFGESTAILSATALLNRSFGILSRLSPLSPEQRVELIDLLSFSVGSTGLIAGQMADLANTGEASVTEIERVNQLKTGALFDFAADAAAILAESSAGQRAALKDFSRQIGLAFQSLDDVKDVLQNHLESGKSAGRDEGKTTLLAKEGLADTKARLEGYMESARMALKRANLSNAETLDYVVSQQFSFLDAL